MNRIKCQHKTKINKFYGIKDPQGTVFFLYVKESRKEVITAFLQDKWVGGATWQQAYKYGWRTVEVVVVESKDGEPI